jgi:hypothetical protein
MLFSDIRLLQRCDIRGFSGGISKKTAPLQDFLLTTKDIPLY